MNFPNIGIYKEKKKTHDAEISQRVPAALSLGTEGNGRETVSGKPIREKSVLCGKKSTIIMPET